VIQLGAMWCCLEAKGYMGAIVPHLRAMCDHTGAACTIWKPYSADGLDPGASVEVTRQGHIGFYSGALRATFRSKAAKQRRCGACRRLVSFSLFGGHLSLDGILRQSLAWTSLTLVEMPALP
jgi:hypothetical protein